MKIRRIKKVLKDEVHNIPEVYEKIKPVAYMRDVQISDEHIKTTIRGKSFNQRMAFSLTSIILFLVVSFGVLFLITDNTSSNTYRMLTVKDQEDLQDIVSRSYYTEGTQSIQDDLSIFDLIGSWFNRKTSDSADVKPNPESPTFEEKGNDFSNVDQDSKGNSSKTNVQVEGIDEADIIKTDDKYIYYGSSKGFYVVSADKGILKLEKKITFNEDSGADQLYYDPYRSLCQIYLTDKYVAVMYEVYEYINAYTTKDTKNTAAMCYTVNKKVEIRVFDKNDDFKEVKLFETYGFIVDTRLYNNILYFVINTDLYDMYYSDSIITPFVSIDSEKQNIDYTDIHYLTDGRNEAYTIIGTIDLENINADYQIQLGAYGWNAIYASKNALYLASRGCYNNKNESIIYCYKYKGTTLEYSGFAVVSGVVNEQWYLDENDGYLRVVTVDWGWRSESDSINKLGIFDLNKSDENGMFELVGSISKGIGLPGETVRSVRFDGDFVNIVTYLNTDPLYKIDVSNPRNPKIIGLLKAPGYSTYMHKIGDDYLLGLGYTDNGQYKLSLYDNSGDNPMQIGDDYIFNNTAYIEINHRALFTMGNYFGLATQDGYYNSSVYYLFEIVPEDTIDPIKIRHLFQSNNAGDYDHLIRRLVCINNYYYTVSNSYVKSYDSNFNLIEELGLRDFQK